MDKKTEDILAQLARDVDGAYPRLWSMYIDQLYAYVARKTMNQEDARDIVQDVFERVYRALKSYPPERILDLKLRSWLYTITDHVCLNYKTRYLAGQPLPLDTSEESVYLDIPDTESEPPDVIVETFETRNELLALIFGLPRKYRDPLVWHFFNGLSYDEIAARLQQKGATIRVQIHRGISRLRQTLTSQQREYYRKSVKANDE
jgi:RNA polymerase sigma-70 factor (ECF subfamily)